MYDTLSQSPCNQKHHRRIHDIMQMGHIYDINILKDKKPCIKNNARFSVYASVISSRISTIGRFVTIEVTIISAIKKLTIAKTYAMDSGIITQSNAPIPATQPKNIPIIIT